MPALYHLLEVLVLHSKSGKRWRLELGQLKNCPCEILSLNILIIKKYHFLAF